MDKLRALRYFANLAVTLNFSATADHFRVPSSSVSRRIKDLEQELGATLFERTTRSVRLTGLGRLYLREVTSALQSIEMADQLVARRLGNHEFILVASPDYIAQNGIPMTSDDLKNHPVFMYRTQNGVLDWLTLRDGVWTAIELNPKYISNHGKLLLDSVIAGRGVAFLPNWGVAKDIAVGKLRVLELEDGPLSVSGNAKTGLYLLYHPPKFQLQKIRVAVDFLVKELGFSSTEAIITYSI